MDVPDFCNLIWFLSFIDNKIAKNVILSFIDNKIAKIVILLFTDNEIACWGVVLWGGEMNSEAVSVGWHGLACMFRLVEGGG